MIWPLLVGLSLALLACVLGTRAARESRKLREERRKKIDDLIDKMWAEKKSAG